MRYSFEDLGEQQEGTTVRVALHRGRPNVILLDRVNFAAYRAGGSFRYYGGVARRRHSALTVPYDGHWFLVVDFGGYGGRGRVSIQAIEPPSGHPSDADQPAAQPMLTANA